MDRMRRRSHDAETRPRSDTLRKAIVHGGGALLARRLYYGRLLPVPVRSATDSGLSQEGRSAFREKIDVNAVVQMLKLDLNGSYWVFDNWKRG